MGALRAPWRQSRAVVIGAIGEARAWLSPYPGDAAMFRNLASFAVALALFAGAHAHAQQGTPADGTRAVATFAGGCFWCMEPPFDKLPGVISTTSGYIGGKTVNPTYRQVVEGDTGHAEAVQVVYDPTKITYEKLLEVFWRNVDPFDAGGQFCDRGDSYRSGIFVHDEAQLRLAQASKQAVAAKLKKPVVTEVVLAPKFYPAEDYHQDYYVKNPVRYKVYRSNCGRDARLKQVWGDEATN
jgi:peptide-methionine (S)-S-oxide reductase